LIREILGVKDLAPSARNEVEINSLTTIASFFYFICGEVERWIDHLEYWYCGWYVCNTERKSKALGLHSTRSA
jgi:hypothetical protein